MFSAEATRHPSSRGAERGSTDANARTAFSTSGAQNVHGPVAQQRGRADWDHGISFAASHHHSYEEQHERNDREQRREPQPADSRRREARRSNVPLVPAQHDAPPHQVRCERHAVMRVRANSEHSGRKTQNT
jgi:hypothetical protein